MVLKTYNCFSMYSVWSSIYSFSSCGYSASAIAECKIFYGNLRPFAHNQTYSWWRHWVETFSALLTLCVGNSPVIDEFPSQRPVTQSFDIFFDLRLNKWLSKQSWGWVFETPSRLTSVDIERLFCSGLALIHFVSFIVTSTHMVLLAHQHKHFWPSSCLSHVRN